MKGVHHQSCIPTLETRGAHDEGGDPFIRESPRLDRMTGIIVLLPFISCTETFRITNLTHKRKSAEKWLVYVRDMAADSERGKQ